MRLEDERCTWGQRVRMSMQVFREFTVDTWLILLLKFMESYGYYILAYELVVFLSEEYGFTDQEAGWCYGVHNTLVSVYGFAIGTWIDNVGVKWSLTCGFFILFCSRIALTCVSSIHALLFILFVCLPVGSACGIPVLAIGMKRHCEQQHWTIAFSAFYIVMNVAAVTAAPMVDAFHMRWPDGVEMGPFFGIMYQVSSYRLLIFSSALLTLGSFFIAFLVLRDKVDRDEPKVIRSPASIYREVLSQPQFWRFMLLIVLLVGVRFVYRNLDATFPKYMVRELGHEALYGSVIAINPLCVIIAVPILSVALMHVAPLKMIFAGAVISSVSPLVLASGHSYGNCVGFVTVLSLGEALWSPRLFQYTLSVAPSGKEGTYMALASTPTFLSTLMIGAVSGVLLDRFCPEHGEKRGEVMWMCIAAIAMVSPVLMYLLMDVIEPPAPTLEQKVVTPRKNSAATKWGAFERMEAGPNDPWHRRLLFEAQSFMRAVS
mmetsp:Transcript_32935/g.71897  ORF Transcript_32935/g.71897 Transcript_32935/m.71897 type:complete len:488 (+) Transcript_32935:176-1639(+)